MEWACFLIGSDTLGKNLAFCIKLSPRNLLNKPLLILAYISAKLYTQLEQEEQDLHAICNKEKVQDSVADSGN